MARTPSPTAVTQEAGAQPGGGPNPGAPKTRSPAAGVSSTCRPDGTGGAGNGRGRGRRRSGAWVGAGPKLWAGRIRKPRPTRPRPAVTHLELARLSRRDPSRPPPAPSPLLRPCPAPSARPKSHPAAPATLPSPRGLHEVPGARGAAALGAPRGRRARGPRGALTVEIVLQVHGGRHLRPRPRSGSARAGGAAGGGGGAVPARSLFMSRAR